MTIPIGKYMHAEPLLCDPHEVYTIHARDGSSLGYAEWYPRWRGYVFSPEDGIVLSWDCCLEMSRFLENCNKATKALGGNHDPRGGFGRFAAPSGVHEHGGYQNPEGEGGTDAQRRGTSAPNPPCTPPSPCEMCNGVGFYVSLPGDVITPCPGCSGGRKQECQTCGGDPYVQPCEDCGATGHEGEKDSTRLTADAVDSGSNDSAPVDGDVEQS